MRIDTTGKMFALVSAVGVPLVIAGTCVKNYAKAYGAAISRYGTAKLMPYDVPSDGSVSLTDIGRREGLETNAELSAFRTVASENMFGKGKFTHTDSQGNTTVYNHRWAPDVGRYTVPVEIPSSDWVGGLPKGRTVFLPDVNRDDRIGPDADYRTQNKRGVMAGTRNDARNLKTRGMMK